jgi:antitoxin component HigA of HigAB toxin-antitoxin module
MNRRKLTPEVIDGSETSIENLPPDSKIFVDKSIAIRHAVLKALHDRGMTQKELADAMGKSEAEVSKILSPMYNLTLRMICKLEAALKKTIIHTN